MFHCTKLVEYEKYCGQCKYNKESQYDNTEIQTAKLSGKIYGKSDNWDKYKTENSKCESCLNTPARIGTEVPLNFRN